MRLALALALWAAPAGAVTLDPPAGATLAATESEAPGRLALATGPWADGALPLEAAEGTVTRRAWQVPDPGTTLALLAPLRAQLEAQGLTVRLDCDAAGCGGFDFRAGIEVMAPPAMFVDLGDFRYLSATGDGEAVALLVSRSGGTGFVQAITVGAAPPGSTDEAPEAGREPVAIGPAPPPEPGPLGARLEAEGRVVIEGLAFASGSADVSGGEAALDALGAWLAADPGRRVAIVGHTDATGSLDANVALSRRRAEAVAADLRDRPGVGRGQVEAGGMGYLAPLATNLTPEGRALNRRVEAVALPPA